MRRLMIFLGLLLAITSVQAQDTDLTATIEAGVQARFTATAEAAGSDINATLDAAFQQAQTATQSALDLTSPTSTITPMVTLDPAAFQITGSPMAVVDGGSFVMGTTAAEVRTAVDLCVTVQAGNCTIAFGEDSTPQHEVTLNTFEMEITEVTYGQFVTFLNSLGAGSHRNGCDGQPCMITRAENENATVVLQDGLYNVPPIVVNVAATNVTWYGAKAYCEALGRRLPTEAEWERAAKGSDGRIYPWGGDWDPLFARTSIPETGDIGALPVGSYPLGASPYGLLDMAGNVAEWVNDWYSPTYYSLPQASTLNPQGPPNGDQKVVRGGSWDAKPFFARTVHRQSFTPAQGGAWLGFRCAADYIPPTLTPTSTLSAPATPTPTSGPTATPTATPTLANTVTPLPTIGSEG